MARNGRKKGAVELVAALASGLTVRAACKRAHVSVRTAFRRMAEPDFRREVVEARAGMFDRALGRMSSAAVQAASTLRKLLDARADTTKLAAARALLEHGAKLREQVDLERRISDLEMKAKG